METTAKWNLKGPKMNSEGFSKNILSLDPAIWFAGLIESSGHLFAGGMREGTDTQLKGKTQTWDCFDLLKLSFWKILRRTRIFEICSLWLW